MIRIWTPILFAALTLASGCVYIDAEPAEDGSSGTNGTENAQPDVRLEARGGPFMPGDDITVDASGTSDVEGDELTYEWAVFGPNGNERVFGRSVSGRAIEFSAPDEGLYIVRVSVSDGVNAAVDEAISVQVRNARPDIAVSTCGQPTDLLRYQRGSDWLEIELGSPQTMCLDASSSSDAEGHALSYQWVITGTPQTTVDTTYSGAVLRLDMDESGYYEGFLQVTDEFGATSSMDFSVVVR